MPGYWAATESAAHHLQNYWTILLRAAVKEGTQTGYEVGVPSWSPIWLCFDVGGGWEQRGRV